MLKKPHLHPHFFKFTYTQFVFPGRLNSSCFFKVVMIVLRNSPQFPHFLEAQERPCSGHLRSKSELEILPVLGYS